MIEKIITGNLKTLTGLHIGTGEVSETTDSPIHRNINGEIVIPGTAIAGSLRTLATRLAPYLEYKKCVALDEDSQNKICNCLVCNLFGSLNIDRNLEEGKASKLWVNDAILKNDLKASIRDGVGIDRETGAASRKARAKYDFEVVPKGSVFSFKIAIQDDLSEAEERLLSCILAEWQRGRGYIGGNISRGMGNIQLEDIKVFSLDLSNINALMTFLREDDEIKAANEEKNWLEKNIGNLIDSIKNGADANIDDEYLFNSFVQIDLVLKFTGSFVINDVLKSVQSGFDFYPKMENGKFIFPGSSFRGIIRSHAEKIARSLVTLDADDENSFIHKCPACNPFAEERDPLTSCNAILRKRKGSHGGEVKKDELCLACRLFGCSFMGSRLYVSDGELIGSPEIKIMDFLAVDRFTGGGKEGAKFDAVVLWQPKFKIHIFIENPKDWQLGWIMLVMKDLKDGLVSFGFGKNKWFGKATIENEAIKIGAISEKSIPKGLKKGSRYEGLFNVQTLSINDLLNTDTKPIELWINDFHETLANFTIADDLISESDTELDTYFRDDISVLYPKEVIL